MTNFFILKENLENYREELKGRSKELPLEDVYLSEFSKKALINSSVFTISNPNGFVLDTGFRFQKKIYKIVTIQKIENNFYYLIDLWDKQEDIELKNICNVRG